MYTFKLNIGSLTSPVKGGGYIDVSPILEDNGLVKTIDSTYFSVVRKKIKKEVFFKEAEYRALYQLRTLKVSTIEMKVYYNDELRWYGYLLLSGSWDEDRQTCELETQTIDQYSEFKKNLDKETNIIGYANNTIKLQYQSILIEVTLPCFKGSRAEAEFFYDPNGLESNDPLNANADWAYYADYGEIYCGEAGTYQYKYRSTYVNFEYPGFVKSVLIPSQYLKKETQTIPILKELKRASKLYDVLVDLLDEADPNITINESTYSDYINDSSNEIDYLYIMDKSDVKRNIADDISITPATYEMITVNEVIKLYLDWFGLSYKIDDNSNFTFKRKSDLTEQNYTTNPQYDLTTYKGRNFTENQKKYNSNLSKRPCKETIIFESCNKRWFDKSELVYDSYTDNIEERNHGKFNNNVDYLITNPDEVSDNGFCLITASNSGVIRNQTPEGGTSLINGGMSANLLFYNHLLENKPYSVAELDKVEVDLTLAKNREVIYKNIPIYDIDAIDFDYYVKTELGLAEPQELEISFNNKFATLKLNI